MKKKQNNRTTEIHIQEEEAQSPIPNPHYKLHIDAPLDPHAQHRLLNDILGGPEQLRSNPQTNHRRRIAVKIWNFLEWLAISSLIFMALFLVLNWQSYSTLLKNKIDKVTGNFELSPFIAQEFTEKNIEQNLLPAADTTASFSSQVPHIDFDITPPDDRIIIPRINKNVPVVPVNTENLIKKDWGALEGDIQEALKDGVVHYPGTARVGQKGNVVLTGHSSYFPWDPGRFKDVFALLHEVAVGDRIIVYEDQKKVQYEVYETRIVSPAQVDVLTQQGENRLTLITCTPIGTNLKRLIILARPV